MEDNKILKMIYTLFLGVLIALFVGVGINTFYPAPKAPEYPPSLNTYEKEATSEQVKLQKEFDQHNIHHQEEMKPYNRNVSIATMVIAIALLALSIVSEKKIRVLADGVMLGGLFTLIYSIGRGFASEDSKYVFLAITVGLVTVMYLGYHRFVKPDTTKTKKKSKR